MGAPQKIGKYQIVDTLGTGGMGVVYKAEDRSIGRAVALKVMSSVYGANPELRERFLREARSAGMLQHPNIVVVYELGEDDGNLFIAMEYIKGRSLDQLIAQKQLAIGEKLSIIAQVCDALGYAHADGVIHRDIKPANVIVTANGMAKIVDFGLARIGDKQLTRTGQVLGTVSYMSPEQINGLDVDYRTDIFSTGVMLYQLLTGTLPFDAESTAATMMKIVSQPAPPLRQYLPVYPPMLQQIVDRALAKKREERYATAAEFQSDVQRARAALQGGEAQAATAPLPQTAPETLVAGSASMAQVAAAVPAPARVEAPPVPPPAAPAPPYQVPYAAPPAQPIYYAAPAQTQQPQVASLHDLFAGGGWGATLLVVAAFAAGHLASVILWDLFAGVEGADLPVYIAVQIAAQLALAVACLAFRLVRNTVVAIGIACAFAWTALFTLSLARALLVFHDISNLPFTGLFYTTLTAGGELLVFLVSLDLLLRATKATGMIFVATGIARISAMVFSGVLFALIREFGGYGGFNLGVGIARPQLLLPASLLGAAAFATVFFFGAKIGRKMAASK